MTQITDDTGVLDTLRQAVDGASAGRVFGEPVVHDGIILLPVAVVAGGGGGGGGSGPGEAGSPEASGSGGGFGTTAKGLGVFVLKDGKVSWHPAIDVNRIVLGGQLVAVVALLVARSVLSGRKRTGLPTFPSGRWPTLGKSRRKAIRSAAKALRAQVTAAQLPSLPRGRG